MNIISARHFTEALRSGNHNYILIHLYYMCLFKQKKIYNTKRNGFVTLLSVLVTSAVGVALTLSVILLGVGSSRTSFAITQSNQAKALANACAEEAMQKIRDLSSFAETGNLTLGQGTCSYAVTNQGGEDRTITASGVVGTITRKVKIIIDMINPTIRIVSWQEVADL